MKKPTRARHSELLAVLRGELKEFQVQLINALNKPVTGAEHAESADTLEGKTPAEIQVLAMNEVTKHTSKLGQNVHGLDPHDLDTYNKQEFDKSFDSLMDLDSGVPLDFYGDREFLPPAVTGSFESGSTSVPYGAVAMMLEDNGTLMILRSGTDGDTSGVFYSYLRNAQTETDIDANLVMSNARYHPAYFPDGMSAKAILSGTQDLIIGIMKNDVTGAHTGYFISMTNNTMDQTKHTGIFVPLNGFIQLGEPRPALWQIPFGFIKGNYAYILHDLRSEGKLGHRVWRINRAELISGNFTSATQIKGWTINRGTAGNVARDDIVLFDNINDAVIKSGKPHTVYNADNGNDMPIALKRDNGTVSVLYSPYIQLAPDDLLSNIGSQHWYMRYEFDEVTKTIDASKYWNNKVKTIYPVGGVIIGNGDSAAVSPGNVFSHPKFRNNQDSSCLYTTVFNQMWLWTSISFVSGGRTLVRLTFADDKDPAEMLDGKVDALSVVSTVPVGRYGSAVTTVYRSGGALGENVLVCKNNQLVDGKLLFNWVRVGFSGSPTFQYSSVTGNYAFKGFAPTTDRKGQKQMGWADDQLDRMVTEASPGVSKNHKGRFSSWHNETSRAENITTNGVQSGAITCPRAVIRALETQIEADLRSKGYRPYTASANSYFALELIIPQAYTDMPAFAYGSWINEDRYVYNFIYSVTIAGTRQAITNASIIASSATVVKFVATAGTMLGMASLEDCAPNTLRRVNGGFVAALGECNNLAVVGNGCRPVYLATYTTATGKWAIVEDDIYWDYFNETAPMGWYNFPSRGLYFGFSSEFTYGQVDCGSKLLATPACTTDMPQFGPSALRFRAGSPDYGIVLLSQRVVNAWTVYFSDDSPAMLDGFYYTVQPLTHVLDSITAANKTFHVWLVRSGDTLEYRIVDSSIVPPSGKSLYLGYFTTNNTGIETIKIEKRVAVGGMMLSADPRGNAIPLTSGTPNNAGRLNWR